MDYMLGRKTDVDIMKWYEAVVIVCILLHSVLDIYVFYGPFTFGNVADVIALFLCVVSRKKENRIPSAIWWYIGYRIIASAATLNSWQSLVPIGFILQVAALVATFRLVKLSNLIKIYRILGFITTLFFVFQYISFTFFDVKISGVLDFLPIALGEDDFLSVLEMRDRQSSIFSEPAHFADFLLPLLLIELFYQKGKGSIILIILSVFSLIFSMSGTGLLGLVVIGVLFLINHIMENPNVKRVSLAFVIILAIPVAAYYYSHSEMGEMVLGRADDVKSAQNAARVSSEYVRLFRGYDIYGELSLTEKVFGCGDKTNIIKGITKTRYSSLFDSENFYFNGVSTILLYTGIIGLLLYYWALLTIWKKNSFAGRTFVILLITLMLIGSIVLNATAVILLFLSSTIKSKQIRLIKSS